MPFLPFDVRCLIRGGYWNSKHASGVGRAERELHHDPAGRDRPAIRMLAIHGSSSLRSPEPSVDVSIGVSVPRVFLLLRWLEGKRNARLRASRLRVAVDNPQSSRGGRLRVRIDVAGLRAR